MARRRPQGSRGRTRRPPAPCRTTNTTIGAGQFLAGPAPIAASALLGYMGPPSELGLAWVPELYEV